MMHVARVCFLPAFETEKLRFSLVDTKHLLGAIAGNNRQWLDLVWKEFLHPAQSKMCSYEGF